MILDIPFSKVKKGDRAEICKKFSEAEVIDFSRLSGDLNPIHIDSDFAKKTAFKKRVVHGMFSASLISAVIGTKLPGINTIYLEQKLIFTGPVYIGDTVTARVEVIEKIENKHLIRLKTEVINQSGETVINGEALVMKKESGEKK